MGHGSGADEPAACRVLPVIDEEPESEGSPEMTTTMAERRKAIVSRMRELLRRAAAAQSAHSKLRRSTVATANKWKRAVGRIHNRGASTTASKQDHRRGLTTLQDDSSSVSSKSSFSWDATEETCSSAITPSNCSPPAYVSAQDDTTSGQLMATSILRLSCTGARRISSGSDDDMRMAHWVTTDSDFVVLEL